MEHDSQATDESAQTPAAPPPEEHQAAPAAPETPTPAPSAPPPPETYPEPIDTGAYPAPLPGQYPEPVAPAVYPPPTAGAYGYQPPALPPLPAPEPPTPDESAGEKGTGRGRQIGGIILIALGAIFLAQYYLPGFDVAVVVAVVLILVGILLVFRGRKS